MLDVEWDAMTSLDKNYVEAIGSLWRDKGVVAAYNRRREFQLSDSAK